MRIVERKEVGQALKAFCDKYDTYAEAAKKLGITPSQLSSALNKPKSVVPAKALKKLGFEFKAVYLSKEMPLAPAKARPGKAKAKAASLKKPAPKAKRAPPMRNIASGMGCEGGHTPDWSGLRRAYGECKVCGTIIEPSNPPVAPVEPDNPDIYVPDDKGNNTPILPEPQIDEIEEPMFDDDGYPIYN